ncbi:MAG: SCO family protein [Nocardioidaceae bacterium]
MSRLLCSRSATAAVSVVAVASLSACGGAAQSQDPAGSNPAGVIVSGVHQDTTFHGAEPATPYTMPDITLTATNGNGFNLVTDTAYPVTLVFFGYTNCPDVCPLVMSDLTSAYLRLPAPARAKTQVLFITTDPARDTPAVLTRYLERYDSRFVGLTGDIGDIKAAARAMGVAITGKERLPGGGYDVGHGAQVIGFRGNRAPVIWTQGTPVRDMVSDITALAGS